MSKLISVGAVTVKSNKDSGSLHLGSAIPTAFQKMGKPAAPLFIHLSGEDKPRAVTYVMGSQAKGWSVCTKGAGEFQRGEDINLEVTILTEE